MTKNNILSNENTNNTSNKEQNMDTPLTFFTKL